jgi:hypothetical protein
LKALSSLSLAMTLCCVACGGIDVTRISSADTPLTGVPWNLAMTQYNLTITRQITSCSGTIEGAVVVTVASTKVLDEQQKYLLDSNGWWATSDITSTLGADGTSLGLNAASQNADAAIIANVVSLAAQIAMIAAAQQGAYRLVCTEKVAKALSVLNPPQGKKLEEEVNELTKTLTAATTRVSTLTQQAQNNSAYKRELAAAIGVAAAAQKDLTAKQALLDKTLKDVTDKQQVTWPPQADKFRTDKPYKISAEVLKKWVTWVDGQGTPPATFPGESTFNVSLALFRQKEDGSWLLPPAPAVGDVSVGVPVRLPKIGRLLVCTGPEGCPDSLTTDWSPNEWQTVGIQPEQPVLQLGQVYNIRVRGGAFKSESAVIALDANGIPTTITVSEKVAAAAALTGALASTATSISAIPGQIAAAQLARTQAQTSQINAQNALITAQANAQTAGATSTAQAQLSMYTAQASLAAAQANAQSAGPNAALAAQLQMLTNQNAVTNAQAAGAVAPQVSALNAQTSLLNAQASQINAALALAKAQGAIP